LEEQHLSNEILNGGERRNCVEDAIGPLLLPGVSKSIPPDWIGELRKIGNKRAEVAVCKSTPNPFASFTLPHVHHHHGVHDIVNGKRIDLL